MAPEDRDDVPEIYDRRFDFGDDLVRIRVLGAPESDIFPGGVKYAFHYGAKGGDNLYSGTTTTTVSMNAMTATTSKKSTFPAMKHYSNASAGKSQSNSTSNRVTPTMTDNTLTIRVEPPSEFFEDVLEDMRQLDQGKDIEPKQTLSVPVEEALARVLSAKNVELLRAIVANDPTSIRELARLVDRDIKNVSTALNELEELGLVMFEQDGRAKRPVVWYDEINVQLLLRDEGDDSNPVEAPR